MTSSPPPTRSVLSVRTAVLLVLSLLTGLGAAGLTLLAGRSVPEAALAGFAAAGAGAALFNALLDHA